MLGASTDLLELCWLVKTRYMGWSWWFSPCHVVLRGSSLQGPTSISLLWLYKGYICVPHWCWVVALIFWNFIGYKHPVSGCSWWFSPFHIMLLGHSLHYIPHLGMEKVGVARSVCLSTSSCHTNGILRHKCHRIFIIYCILVTTMSHQWKSAARMSKYIPHLGMEKVNVVATAFRSYDIL